VLLDSFLLLTLCSNSLLLYTPYIFLLAFFPGVGAALQLPVSVQCALRNFDHYRRRNITALCPRLAHSFLLATPPQLLLS
jgi:hypothetical protein